MCVCLQDSAAVVECDLSAAIHERYGEAAGLAAYLHHLPRLWHRRQPQQRHLHSLSRRGEQSVIRIPLSHSRLGGWSLPWSSPGSSTGVLDCFGSEGWATTPAEPGRVLGSIAPDVLPFLQHHYSVNKWWSPGVQYGADGPPAKENGQCITVPPWHWSLVQLRSHQRCVLRIFHVCEHSMDIRSSSGASCV